MRVNIVHIMALRGMHKGGYSTYNGLGRYARMRVDIVYTMALGGMPV